MLTAMAAARKRAVTRPVLYARAVPTTPSGERHALQPSSILEGQAMGFFRRTPGTSPNYNDPALDDASWLASGESRYRSLVSEHYGSPDTIAAGGDQRSGEDDPASALFFYQKAIDTLHSIYVAGFSDTGQSGWSRQPSARDLDIADRYLQTLRTVRQLRPGAPVRESVTEVTHRLRTISSKFANCGLDHQTYLDRLALLGDIAPDIDVSGVFWS